MWGCSSPFPSRCSCRWPPPPLFPRPRSRGSLPGPAVPPRRGPPRRQGALPPRLRRSGPVPVPALPVPVPAARGWRRAWRSPRRGWRGRCGAGPGRAGQGSRARHRTDRDSPDRGSPWGSAGRRWRASPGSAPSVPKSAQCRSPGRVAGPAGAEGLSGKGRWRAGSAGVLPALLPSLPGLKAELQRCLLSHPEREGGVARAFQKISKKCQREPAPPRSRCCGVLWPGRDHRAGRRAAAAPGPGGPGALGSQGRRDAPPVLLVSCPLEQLDCSHKVPRFGKRR